MRCRLLLAAVLLASLAPRAIACELDGLFHGYGPTAALFAGAHRYQSLNGMADDVAPEPVAAAPASTPSTTGSTASSPAPPVGPRRSFVAWAKAKPKPAAPGEAPAAWVRPEGNPERLKHPAD